MEIILNEKTYVTGVIKSRAFRQAIEISESVDFDNLKAKDLDVLIDYVVNVFNKQFTRDEFYDGLPATQLYEVIGKAINGVVNGGTEIMDTMPC